MYALVLGLFILYFFLLFYKIRPSFYYKIIAFTMWIPVLFWDPFDLYIHGRTYLDILRFITEMDIFRQSGWDAMEGYDTIILSKLYVYYGSLFESDLILPITNVILCYFLTGFTIHKLAKEWNITPNAERYIMLYTAFMINFIRIISNIRMPLAAVIFVLLLVYDLCIKRYRRWCHISYVVLVALHPGVMMWIIVRLLANVSIRKALLIIIPASFLFFMGFDYVIAFAASAHLDFLSYALLKLLLYTGGEVDMIFNVPFRTAWCSIDASVFILSVILYKNLCEESLRNYKTFLLFSIYTSIISFFGTVIGDQTITTRFTIIELSMLGIYAMYFKQKTLFVTNGGNKFLLANFCFIFMLIVHGGYTIYHNIQDLGLGV